MAWRFKASKYKNAAPIVPKPEACVRDVCVGSYQTYGNNICASASFMAFNWEHVGSSMAVLPLDDCGRKSKTMPLLHAHSDTITSSEFSPFHDGLLMTGSQDALVKIWHIPPEGLKESLSTPECTLSQKQRRVDNVGFHPVADGLIHVASGHQLALWDLTKQEEAYVNRDHTDVIQSVSWKKDGRLLASSSKDKRVRVLDPRAPAAAAAAASHRGARDSRVVWAAQDNILTTGFDSARLRQIMIRDIRNFNTPIKTLELDCSTGVLMPLYDADTNMLFLVGKGDTTILYMEVIDREPFLIEGLRHTGEQSKGACLVPKRALRVMEGEVNRVLQLTSSSVIPVTYQVPRKSYRDYHADLYPDTAGPVTYLSAPMWLDNMDHAVPTISLDPAAASCAQVHRGNLDDLVKAILAMPVPKKQDSKKPEPKAEEPKPAPKTPQPEEKEKEEEDRIDFVNVKDLIKGMEQKKEPAVSPMKTETNGFHKDNGHSKSEEDCETDGEKSLEKTDSTESESPSSHSNGLSNGVPLQAPKPLPRSSISEGGSGEEQEVPKPKPRTTAAGHGGYKPRLGPKPFSASTGSEEFSFDKVFSVPAAPGDQKNQSAVTTPVTSTPKAESEEKEKSLSPTSDVETTTNKEEYTNGKSDTSVEEEVSSDSGYRPKTPGTAERRKLFENTTTVTDGANQSIADRRRAYEMRSVSVAVESDTPASPAPLRRRDSLKSRKSPEREDKRASVPNVTTKRTSTVFGRVSKFRHLKGTPGHKSTHIENIKNISRQISGECNGFYANGYFATVPIAGGGGRLAVIPLPVGATPVSYATPATGGAPPPPPLLLHPAALQHWALDPFCPHRLMVACDDGSLNEWTIPEGGLKESTNQPERTFAAHPDKIYLILFHGTARDVLASAAHDLSVKIWDLSEDTPTPNIVLKGHTDQIFAMDWSVSGEYLATLCKDGNIRIYNPRASPDPIRSGPGPAGSRGGRVVWALHDTHLVVTGFDKVSERQILLYSASSLAAPLCTVGLDVSPAILQLHIDHDSRTLFLTGRGDSTIYCYEVTCEAPYLCPLSHHRCARLHQGLSFLQKNHVAVEKVEFARALRLTNGCIEPLSFTVPRIKSELFQDDLFPPTLVTWEPWQEAKAWFASAPVSPRLHSLQPPGMESLSAHSLPSPQPKEAKEKERAVQKPKPDLIKSHVPYDPKDKQDSIMKSMSAKVQVNLKLEQDNMEGVDETEWEQ